MGKMQDNLFCIVGLSKTQVRCVFCWVQVPKAVKCIEQHINGSKHKQSIDLMFQHGINANNAQMIYCKPCKKYLENESVTKHIDGDSHSNWMAAMNSLVEGEFIKIEGYLSSMSDNVFCDVCKSDIHCTLQNIEKHVGGLSHRGWVAEKLKPLNGIFRVEDDDELWCKICNAYIDNTIPSVLDHIDEDDDHMKWFMEIEDLIEDQDITIAEYLADEFEKFAHCKKCNADIICNAQSLQQHVNSESHLNQLS